MRDRTLGVRLELITQFQTAAKSAVTELRTVVTGLEEVKKAGAESNLTGISDLTAAVDRLSKRIDSSLGSINAMGQAATSVGAKARTAAVEVDTLGAAAARAGQKANAAAAALGRLGTSMDIGGAISIDRAGTALTGMAREAIAARRAVDELRSSLNALPTTKVTRISVEGAGYNQTSLPSGQSGNARWAQSGPMPIPMALPGETQRALPGGRSMPAPIPLPGVGQEMRNVTPRAALTGGTDPYDVRNQAFNNRVWEARNRANNPGDFGGGPPISVPPGGGGGPGEGGFSRSNFGNGLKDAGRGMRSAGQQATGIGFEAGIAGAIGLGALIPAINKAIDSQDLGKAVTESLLSSTPMTAKQASNMQAEMMQATGKYGGDFSQNVGSEFQFISAAPQDVQAKLGDNNTRAIMVDLFNRNTKLAAIAGSSQSPVDPKALALETTESAKNLFDTKNIHQYSAALKTMQNVIINLKNNYDTTGEAASKALLAVGPIAKLSGVKADAVIGIIAIAASTGSFGNKAGNDAKRIVQRAGQDPKALRDLQAAMLERYHVDISMFDKEGNARSPLEMVATIAKLQKTTHMSDQDRLYMNTVVAGPFAAKTYAALIDHYNQHGTLKELTNVGRKVMYGVPDSKKPGDSLTQSHANRQDSKMEEQKLGGKYNVELVRTFTLIEPQFLKVLQGINGLIEGFSKLDPNVKKFMIGFLAFGAVGLTIIGVLGILGGAVLAIGGAFAMIAGSAIAATFGVIAIGVVGLIASVGLLLLAWNKNFLGIRDIAKNVFSAIGSGAQAFARGFVQYFKEVGNGAKIVGHFLIELGSNTKAGLKVATDGVMGFVGNVGKGFNIVTGAVSSFVTNVGNGFMKVATTAVTEGKRFLDWYLGLPGKFMSMVGDFAHAGLSIVSNFIGGILGGIPAGVEKVKGALAKIGHLFPHSEPKDSSSPLYGLTKSGATSIDMYTDGVVASVASNKSRVSGALSDMRVAYAAPGDDNGHEFFNSLRDGTYAKAHKAPKVKKAKAAPMDNMLVLTKGETIAEIENTARGIEAALHRSGARIKMGYIDLYDAMSGKSTRVQGNAAAFRLAIKQDKVPVPKFVQDAHDYMRQILNAGVTPASASDATAHLKAIISKYYKELGTHGRVQIETMEKTIEGALKRAQNALAIAHNRIYDPLFGRDGQRGANAQVQTEFSMGNTKANRFNDDAGRGDDKLARTIDLRKNKELPTLKELRVERELEISELNKLQRAYNDEVTQRSRIIRSIEDMEAKTRLITGADADSVATRNAAMEKTAEYRHELDNLNDDLDKQFAKINSVTASVGQYNTAIVQGKSGNSQWAALLTSSFDTASKQALDGVASTFSSSIDGFIEKILGAKGKKGSPFQAAIGTFVGSFVKSMLDGMIKSMLDGMQTQLHGFFSNLGSGNGFLSKIFKGGGQAETQGADLPGMTPASMSNSISEVASAVDTTMKSNLDLNSPLDKTLKTHLGKGGPFDQILGKFSKDVIQPMGGSSQTAAGVAVSGGITDGVAATERQIAASRQSQDMQKASFMSRGMKGIGGAYAAYEGVKTGGIAGGIEAGAGVLSMIQSIAPHFGPWGAAIAGAAAIATMFIHHDNQAAMPDKYDGRRFTDMQAEMIGNNSHGASGVMATSLVDDPILKDTHGVGMLKYIQDYIKNGGAGLTPEQLKQYKTQFGTTGDGGLTYNKDIGQEKVNGGALAGSYTDIHAAALAATQAIMKLKDATITAAQNAATLAASFTTLILGGPAGFAIPLGVTGAGNGGSMLSAPGATGAVRHSPISTPPMVNAPNPRASLAPISIRVLEGAHIANGDPQAIAATIGAMMPGIINQIRRTNYQDGRLYSRYTPLTS